MYAMVSEHLRGGSDKCEPPGVVVEARATFLLRKFSHKRLRLSTKSRRARHSAI